MRHFVAIAVVLIPLMGELSSPRANAAVAPEVLAPGGTVSPLPDGFSTVAGASPMKLYDNTASFSYDGFSGTLRSRVLQYANVVTPAHPYGSGLYFDYEITLTSGSVADFIAPGYTGFGTSVKECGIAGCGGSGEFGVLASSASRSVDGDSVDFAFASDSLVSGTHSANLQLLTDATGFVDPMATLVDANGDRFSVAIALPLVSSVPEGPAGPFLALGLAALGIGRARRAR